ESSFLLVFVFLFAGTTSILHVANIFGFGNFVEGNNGNCYLQKGQQPEQFVVVGFIMMAIFCWIIFGLIATKIYMKWNSLGGKILIRQKWRQILFEDTINVIFILSSEKFFDRFINVTPALILTSLCARRLIITGNNNKKSSLITPLNVKVSTPQIIRNNDSFIINNMPESPIPSASRDRNIRNNSFTGIHISPPTPIMTSDFGPSLTTFFNNYTTMSLDDYLKQRSLGNSQQSSKHTSSNGGHPNGNNNNYDNSKLQVIQPNSRSEGSNSRLKVIQPSSWSESSNSRLQVIQPISRSESYNSRLQIIQPISRSESYNSRSSKKSTRSILQSIFRNDNNSISRENQRTRKNMNPDDDIYYFRYSEANEFDDDVFLFPAIPQQNPSKSKLKKKFTNINKPLPPRPGFF
ncbi:7118_t:CDS:2, partial [Scutellospora calospora]